MLTGSQVCVYATLTSCVGITNLENAIDKVVSWLTCVKSECSASGASNLSMRIMNSDVQGSALSCGPS